MTRPTVLLERNEGGLIDKHVLNSWSGTGAEVLDCLMNCATRRRKENTSCYVPDICLEFLTLKEPRCHIVCQEGSNKPFVTLLDLPRTRFLHRREAVLGES
jgi:hypothetical protein